MSNQPKATVYAKPLARQFPKAKAGDRVELAGASGIFVGVSPGRVEWIAWRKGGESELELLVRAGEMGKRLEMRRRPTEVLINVDLVKISPPKKNDSDEWVVRVSVNGKHHEGRTYYGSDREDALDTAAAMREEVRANQAEDLAV